MLCIKSLKMFIHFIASPVSGSAVKNPPANIGDTRDKGPIPGSERSPVGGNGNPLPYSWLEKSHGQGLVGYSPLGHEESDATE